MIDTNNIAEMTRETTPETQAVPVERQAAFTTTDLMIMLDTDGGGFRPVYRALKAPGLLAVLIDGEPVWFTENAERLLNDIVGHRA